MKGRKIIMYIFIIIVTVFLLFSATLYVQNQKPQTKIGLVDGKFYELSSKPNGVSTQTQYSDKKIEPLAFKNSLEKTKEAFINSLLSYGGIEIIKEEKNYVYAIATTEKMKFHDDIEIYFNEKTKEIHYRSASRAGYSDMGLNRVRFEEISKKYNK